MFIDFQVYDERQVFQYYEWVLNEVMTNIWLVVGEWLVSCRFSIRCGSSDTLDIILKVEMMTRGILMVVS